MLRRALATAGIVTALAGATIAAAGTSAAEPLPGLNIYPPDMPVVGQNAWCHGMIHVAYSYDQAKPGVTTATITSPGFIGNGPEWATDPVCHFGLFFSWGGVQSKNVPLNFGVGPQAPVSVDLPTGYGVNYIGAVAVNNAGPLPLMASNAHGTFTFLPW